jgi:hypothetical protein
MDKVMLRHCIETSHVQFAYGGGNPGDLLASRLTVVGSVEILYDPAGHQLRLVGDSNPYTTISSWVGTGPVRSWPGESVHARCP